MTHRLLTVTIAAALIFANAPVVAVAEDVDPGEYQIVWHRDRTISIEADRDFYGEFRNWGYFSAFAVSQDAATASWGWSAGKSNREFAQERALAYCNEDLEEFGGQGPCVLYAEILPAPNSSVRILEGYTLSQIGSAGFDEYRAYDGTIYKAFAFSANGAWAWNSSNISQTDAERRTLESCERYAEQTEDAYAPCRLAY